MLSFDTLKFSIPIEKALRIHKNSFDYQKRVKQNILLISEKGICQNPITGIKCIIIDYIRKKIIFEISAKILKQKYIENINSNNFNEVIEIIKSSDLLYFKNEDFKNSLEFLKLDVSKNMIFETDIRKYIEALSYIVNSKKYNFQNYHGQSVTFCKNPLSKRRRLRFIFYDKYSELKKDKNFSKVDNVNRYMNILRYEINLNNFFLIKNYLNLKKTDSLNYYNIIENETNIFKNVFDELLNESSQTNNIFDINSEKNKLSEIEKYFGKLSICKNFNYDFKRVSIFLRNHVKGNISKYFTTYKNLCLQGNQTNLNSNYKNLINHIYGKCA